MTCIEVPGYTYLHDDYFLNLTLTIFRKDTQWASYN